MNQYFFKLVKNDFGSYSAVFKAEGKGDVEVVFNDYGKLIKFMELSNDFDVYVEDETIETYESFIHEEDFSFNNLNNDNEKNKEDNQEDTKEVVQEDTKEVVQEDNKEDYQEDNKEGLQEENKEDLMNRLKYELYLNRETLEQLYKDFKEKIDELKYYKNLINNYGEYKVYPLNYSGLKKSIDFIEKNVIKIDEDIHSTIIKIKELNSEIDKL